MTEIPTVPAWGEKLSGWNAAVWRTSTAGTRMRSAMTAVFLLDGTPDPRVLRSRMDRLTREHPALRERIVEPIGPLGQPRLVVDPDFDLDFHTSHITLPAPGTWEVLLRHVRRQSMTDLDRDRPLWRATFMDGLPGGRSAIALTIHHVIADGQGMVMMGAGLLDMEPDAVVDAGDLPPAPAPGSVDRATTTLAALGSAAKRFADTGLAAVELAPRMARGLLTDPGGSTGDAVAMAGSAARITRFHRGPLSPLMTGRSGRYSARTLDVPFDSLRAAAKANGGTINDVFLAAVTGGVRRYHEEHGSDVARIRVNVPISTRTESTDTATNSVTTARLELDAALVDPAARVREASAAVVAARQEPFLPHIDSFAEVMRLAPAEVAVSLVSASDVTASNVPGIPVPVYMAGARLERCYPLVPSLGAAANITMLSYARTWCSLGIDTDDAAIPDPDVFLRCLAEGFAEVGAPLGDHATDPTHA